MGNSNLIFEAVPNQFPGLGRWVRERRPGAPDGRPAEDEEGVLELRGRHPLPHLRVVTIKTGEKIKFTGRAGLQNGLQVVRFFQAI